MLVEDDQFDEGIVVGRDGEETLDYLFRRGACGSRIHDPSVVMPTSSREEQDVVRSYDLGVNAYVVKPVGFHDFVEGIRKVGHFWADVNRPPPRS